MYWKNDSEIVIHDRVYHITNPAWVKNLIKTFEYDLVSRIKYDNDMPNPLFGMKAYVTPNGICHMENGEQYDLNQIIGEENDNDTPKDKETAKPA